VLVTGTIKEPVTWDFSIRICQDDIPGMLKIGLNRHALRLAVRWMLHLKPEHDAPAAEAKDAKARKDMKVVRDVREVDDVDDVKEEFA
jgi:hypothetical protein